MPDELLHCPGGDCPQKQDCERFVAPIYGRQDFFGTPPYDRATGACDKLVRTDEAIRARAYRIWLDEGRPDGRALEHWLRASRP